MITLPQFIIKYSLTFLTKRTLLHSPKSLSSPQIRLSGSNATMRVVKQDRFGGPQTLYIGQGDIPSASQKQVLIEVYGTAVNRADLLMCKGAYPGQDKSSPSEIIGLEASGVVKAVGSSGNKWKVGDRVMALLPNAGYAEYVTVNEDHVMPVPNSLSLSHAGGLPEAWLTAYQLLHFVGAVRQGNFVLIHGGGSGVGTAAVQLARLAGAIPLVTAGSNEKINKAVSLGARAGFNYKEGEFVVGVLRETEGSGANLILDCVGGSFWKQNIACLAFEGTWINYGLLGGGNVEGNLLGQLLGKRGTLTTSTLKSRSDEYKGRLISEFTKNALPYFGKNFTSEGKEVKLQTVVHTEFPLDSVTDAHEYVAQNKNIGKVLLQVKEEAE